MTNVDNVAALTVLADPTALDYVDNPVGAVLVACERATVLLALVLAHGDIDALVELKSQVEAVQVYTRQRKLGREAQLAATEVVRRAERGLGMAIRRGQEHGEIRRRQDNFTKDQVEPEGPDEGFGQMRSPHEFFHGHSAGTEIYGMTDGVTDEAFETALTEAKDEHNLARANVIRKVKGEKPKFSRPEHLRGMRHLDSNRVVERTVLDSGLDQELADQIDFAALDADRLEGWISSLSGVIKTLTTLRRNLKKELSHREG